MPTIVVPSWPDSEKAGILNPAAFPILQIEGTGSEEQSHPVKV